MQRQIQIQYYEQNMNSHTFSTKTKVTPYNINVCGTNTDNTRQESKTNDGPEIQSDQTKQQQKDIKKSDTINKENGIITS